MKRIASIALILLFLSPIIGKVWVIIDFRLHQDFIAEVFCINRDKPKTACKGKCYLSKKLKKMEEGGQKQVPRALQQKMELMFCQGKADSPVPPVSIPEKKDGYPPAPSFVSSSHTGRLLRPPQFV